MLPERYRDHHSLSKELCDWLDNLQLSQITGSSSFHINNAKILYFRVSSINILRPGLEAFGRDTDSRDSPTAL